MIFGEEKDWKELLCPPGQTELYELIERAKQHRCAYMEADDVKVAQLWCSMVELSRDLKEMKTKLVKIETAVRSLSAIGEVAKKEALREKVSDLFKTKTKEEKDQVDKIVDVLMEF